MRLKVKVKPASSENKIIKNDRGEIQIKITKPAEKGKANQAAIQLLAKKLKLPKSVKGFYSHNP